MSTKNEIDFDLVYKSRELALPIKKIFSSFSSTEKIGILTLNTICAHTNNLNFEYPIGSTHKRLFNSFFAGMREFIIPLAMIVSTGLAVSAASQSLKDTTKSLIPETWYNSIPDYSSEIRNASIITSAVNSIPKLTNIPLAMYNTYNEKNQKLVPENNKLDQEEIQKFQELVKLCKSQYDRLFDYEVKVNKLENYFDKSSRDSLIMLYKIICDESIFAKYMKNYGNIPSLDLITLLTLKTDTFCYDFAFVACVKFKKCKSNEELVNSAIQNLVGVMKGVWAYEFGGHEKVNIIMDMLIEQYIMSVINHNLRNFLSDVITNTISTLRNPAYKGKEILDRINIKEKKAKKALVNNNKKRTLEEYNDKNPKKKRMI